MDNIETFNVKIIAALFIVVGSLSLMVSYVNTFPTTVEGRVIVVTYSTNPPWPCTRIEIASLRGEPTIIRLYGHVEVNTGVTYRITYQTPFLNAHPDLIQLEAVK